MKRCMMTAHDTALCIVVPDGKMEIVLALLRHDQTNPNLKNRWFQAILSLVL